MRRIKLSKLVQRINEINGFLVAVWNFKKPYDPFTAIMKVFKT